MAMPVWYMAFHGNEYKFNVDTREKIERGNCWANITWNVLYAADADWIGLPVTDNS